MSQLGKREAGGKAGSTGGGSKKCFLGGVEVGEHTLGAGWVGGRVCSKRGKGRPGRGKKTKDESLDICKQKGSLPSHGLWGGREKELR